MSFAENIYISSYFSRTNKFCFKYVSFYKQYTGDHKKVFKENHLEMNVYEVEEMRDLRQCFQRDTTLSIIGTEKKEHCKSGKQ